MTCPDWVRLTAHRRAAPVSEGATEPRGWSEALEHLDVCPGCRRQAVAADPTLAFRGLPAPGVGPAEVDEIRAGVAALRRAQRLRAAPSSAARPAGDAAGSGGDRSRSRSWTRGAAAAGLLLALAGLGPAVEPERRTGERRAAATAAATEGNAGPAAVYHDPGLLAVDEIEHPTASVYHFDAEEVAVVMVVDAGFDV